MNLQGRNLSQRSRGDDVRLLHSELRKLGYTLPKQERNRRYFGPFTRKAVLDFQRKHSLQATGIVDKTTAAKINAEIASPR